MTTNGIREANRNSLHLASSEAPDQPQVAQTARRARNVHPQWPGWLELWASAGTAFIIAAGSAFLGASTINTPSSTTFVVALVSGAMATANDIRQQMKRPPVEIRRG